MPEISVVIPSYNHARFIKEAVDSVLGQTWTDLEVIVIEDGSQDETPQVLEAIHDPRLKVVYQANQGAHAAINRGLHTAGGKFLTILNSDDAFHPQRLEKCRDLLRDNPRVGLVSSYIQIVDDQSQSLGVKHAYHDCEPWLLEHPELSFRAGAALKDALLTENYLATTSNYFFPRQVFETIGDFRPLRFTHDWDFALRLTQLTDLALIPEPLLRYRVHQSNTIRQDQSGMIFEICWILAMHLPLRASDPNFFETIGREKRIEQLLHSVYTFQCEPVLNVLLLQQLHTHPEQAERLLDPENPERQQYIRYIQHKAHAPENQESGGEPSGAANFTAGVASTSKRWIRRFFGSR